MKTYPLMNREIINLLRMAPEEIHPVEAYAATRIEELEARQVTLLEVLGLIADWPLDPYAHIPELQALGEPQWVGNKSAGVALAAARRLARATIAKL